jgi:hypothetical protein
LGNVVLFSDPKALEMALKEWRVGSQAQERKIVSLWMSSGNFGGVKIV